MIEEKPLHCQLMAFKVLCPDHGELMHTFGHSAYARGHRLHSKKNWVHRGWALGEMDGTSWTLWGATGPPAPNGPTR